MYLQNANSTSYKEHLYLRDNSLGLAPSCIGILMCLLLGDTLFKGTLKISFKKDECKEVNKNRKTLF